MAVGARHEFSKIVLPSVDLVAGVGVAGDAHSGATVQHRSRVADDPNQPNLRQVHLMHEELHEELRDAGFTVAPGSLGENVTTRGVDLLSLPVGSLLSLGDEAILAVTGLRNPCRQLDEFQRGLLPLLAYRAEDGTLVRRAGIMAVVVAGGRVNAGDTIEVTLPPPPHRALDCV